MDFRVIKGFIEKEILTGVDGGLRREVETLYNDHLKIIGQHNENVKICKQFQDLFVEMVDKLEIADLMASFLKNKVYPFHQFKSEEYKNDMKELIDSWFSTNYDQNRKRPPSRIDIGGVIYQKVGIARNEQ